jgi:hypothetical protein
LGGPSCVVGRGRVVLRGGARRSLAAPAAARADVSVRACRPATFVATASGRARVIGRRSWTPLFVQARDDCDCREVVRPPAAEDRLTPPPVENTSAGRRVEPVGELATREMSTISTAGSLRACGSHRRLLAIADRPTSPSSVRAACPEIRVRAAHRRMVRWVSGHAHASRDRPRARRALRRDASTPQRSASQRMCATSACRSPYGMTCGTVRVEHR